MTTEADREILRLIEKIVRDRAAEIIAIVGEPVPGPEESAD